MPAYLMSFIDNWLNQISFSYEFFKSWLWSCKMSLMSRTQIIVTFIFCYFNDEFGSFPCACTK
jgi:hypothetical protein